MAVLDLELVADDAAVLVVVEVDGLVVDLAVQRAQAGLAHEREHLRVVGRRLAHVADVAAAAVAVAISVLAACGLGRAAAVVVADVVVEALVGVEGAAGAARCTTRCLRRPVYNLFLILAEK